MQDRKPLGRIVILVGAACLFTSRCWPQGQIAKDLHGDSLPPRAICRLGTQRFRGGGETLAFSPDGRTIVSGGKNLRLYDAVTGVAKREISNPTTRCRQIAYSPDGKLIGVVGGRRLPFEERSRGCLQLLDVATGAEYATLLWKDARDTNFLHLFPDNATAITGSTDGTLRHWDLQTKTARWTHKLPGPQIGGLAVSADGELVAAVGRHESVTGGFLYLWQWKQNPEARVIPTGSRPAICVAISPDATLLATGHDSHDGQPGLMLWDIAGGQLARTLQASRPLRYVRQVAFTPDGKLLAAINYFDSSIILWDVASGAEVRTLSAAPVKPVSLAISPDSRRVATSGLESVIRVWDIASGQLLGDAADSHQAGVARVQFLSDERRVATAANDGTVRLWDASTGRQLLKCEHQREASHSNWVRGMSVAPDNRFLVSSSLDDTVRVWDAKTGKQIYCLAGHGDLGGKRSLAFFPDGKRFASWGDDLYLRIWNMANGKALAEHKIRPGGLPISDDEAEEVGNIDGWRIQLGAGEFSADASRFALQFGTTTYLFDVETGRELHKFESAARVYDLSISSDGKYLVFSGPPKDGGDDPFVGQVVRVVEADSGKINFELDWWQEVRVVPALSVDNRYLAMAVGREPPSIRIWDIRQGKEVGALSDVPSDIRALAFSPSGRRLASALRDTTVLIWDLNDIVSQ